MWGHEALDCSTRFRRQSVVSVLDEFGVYFDPFTHITLRSKLADVAGHNVLNHDDSAGLLNALKQAIETGPPPEWKGADVE